jgi:hypothetical protein
MKLKQDIYSIGSKAASLVVPFLYWCLRRLLPSNNHQYNCKASVCLHRYDTCSQHRKREKAMLLGVSDVGVINTWHFLRSLFACQKSD